MGGLSPCRQLRPSSRREHVNASSNHKLFIKACTAQLLSRNLKSLLAERRKANPCFTKYPMYPFNSVETPLSQGGDGNKTVSLLSESGRPA